MKSEPPTEETTADILRGPVPEFAFLELNDDFRCMAVKVVAECIATADEKKLFAVLSKTTDIDESIKSFAGEVKTVLRKQFGVKDATNIRDLNGDTCLHYAAKSGHPIVLRFMHHCGLLTDMGAFTNCEGDTPLHEAVRKGRVMLSKQLVFLGADPKIPNNRGQTPMSIARKSCLPELMDALVTVPTTST